ncbi:MAG TPA: hypothetical protein VGM65_14265 [Candidatus Udaeobacter sp.]|jgi:hypothetical protein
MTQPVDFVRLWFPSFASSYDTVNAMLLNEFLKKHRKAKEMQNALGALTIELEEQAAQIKKVSARAEQIRSELVAHNR